jgi:Signal transduction histidine kinase regulating C4-dicarboxylate transport system
MLKRIEFKILIRILLLFLVLLTTSFLLVKGYTIYVFILIPVVIFQLYDLYRFHRKTFEELNNFVESVQYKDFSRHFDVKHAPAELQTLRKGFNRINDAFKIISKEKEMQYQYLQKILELVNTGILSYENETGEVIWMNESLKQMLELPYLKTIHSLSKRDDEMYREIVQLKPGEGKITKAHPERGSFKILLSATAFQTDGKKFKLIAFQNINEAVDETESKAWQKLLSVMTHEIMNSVAPISSLAGTLKKRLDKSRDQLNNETGTVDDLEIGIETIQRRSASLLKFAETYRSLNKITTPEVKPVYVRDLFENIYRLMQPTLDQKNIEMEIVLKETGLIVEADATLIEQVLINLVVNAIEAVKEKEAGRIILSAGKNTQHKIFIKVADNGAGMEEEILEKIFVPFFSTKKNGSGIGLSLCKQIMMVHKGNLQVQSRFGEGTVFTLQF